MNTHRPQFSLNNFLIVSAIASMAIVLVYNAPLSAQVIANENRKGVVHRTPFNNPNIYNNPYNSSIIYGSPIPAPSITYPQDSYNYPSYYPGSVTRVRDYRSTTYPQDSYNYPSYYPNSVTRVRDNRPTTLTNPVLINPTIQDSTFINPTIIQIQPQRRYQGSRGYRRY